MYKSYVEDLKTSNVEHTDELNTLLTGFQSFVDTNHQPLEQTIENGLSHGTDRVKHLSIQSIQKVLIF